MRELQGMLGGRVAIVTGASRGIGAAISRCFAAAGARLVLAARSSDAIESLASELVQSGGDAIAVATDVSDAAAVEALVKRALVTYGRLDAAVNNAAGGGHAPMPLAEVPVDAYDSAFAVNQRGIYLSMKYEIPAMLAGGGGAIVNMASTAALEAVGGLAAYVSTKFAVAGLTRTAALDYAAEGIRVNALAPGPTLTEQLERAGEDARRKVAASLPNRRLGRPDEVAAAAVWLCSDAAALINGAVLPVDGGKMAGMAPYVMEEPRRASRLTAPRSRSA
jgi:NAD(P)-dependent dehydrogenase (short-subunit alcohol dehydrogenase family)